MLTALPGLGDLRTEVGFSGIGYIVLGALGVATGNILLKRLSEKIDPLVVTGWQFLLGGLPLLALAQWLELPAATMWNWTFVVNLLMLGLGGTALRSCCGSGCYARRPHSVKYFFISNSYFCFNNQHHVFQ